MVYLYVYFQVFEKVQVGGLFLVCEWFYVSFFVYEVGDVSKVKDLVLFLYFDGVEFYEQVLVVCDGLLKDCIEVEMGCYCLLLSQGVLVIEVKVVVVFIEQLFVDVDRVFVDSYVDLMVVFFGSLIIFLCEGIEVLLVVVVMIVFLCKVEWCDVLVYVYVGWIVVLVVGGVIWIVVIYLVNISGVN